MSEKVSEKIIDSTEGPFPNWAGLQIALRSEMRAAVYDPGNVIWRFELCFSTAQVDSHLR